MEDMTSDERRCAIKKKSYEKHKASILARMKEKYNALKMEREAAGILPGKRGRPRKYLEDAEILSGRS